MLGTHAADKSIMRSEGSELLNARRKRCALKQVPGGVLVTGGLRAIERILNHRPPEQSRRQRVLALNQLYCWIEQEI